MKKSKIIIPALGVLVLSTAASITGTVAWFTASRSATITTGNFAVVETDGNLSAQITDGVGTSRAESVASSGVYDVINPKSVNTITAKITDVSLDPVNKQLYTKANANASAFRTIGDTDDYEELTDVGHPYKIDDTNYYAFTWKVTFTYEFGADHTDLNIFFDSINSTMTGRNSANNGDATGSDTATGFRIAMIGKNFDGTYGGKVVYGKLQAQANLKAVTGTSTVTTYGTSPLNSGFGYYASNKQESSNAVDLSTAQRAREDYLGKIVYNATPANCKLDVYFIAWYEGTDPNVLSTKAKEQVNSSLKFYSAINGPAS